MELVGLALVPTDESCISVLLPACKDGSPFGIRNEKVGSHEGVESGVPRSHHQHGSVKMSLLHVIDVHRVENCARGW